MTLRVQIGRRHGQVKGGLLIYFLENPKPLCRKSAIEIINCLTPSNKTVINST